MGLIDGTQHVLEQALAGSASRQQVLANNIANADTPNFIRSDLDFQGQLLQAMNGGIAGVNSVKFSSQVDTSSPVQADGNNVNIDSEMSEMSQNALNYETLIEVANARLKMLSDAIGSGGG